LTHFIVMLYLCQFSKYFDGGIKLKVQKLVHSFNKVLLIMFKPLWPHVHAQGGKHVHVYLTGVSLLMRLRIEDFNVE
jgi:hypothetical protein